jgi:hypothetical protein
MTKQEILSQMMREEHDVIHINFYSLAALLAEKLAALGDRLDEDELNVFIGIGAKIYRQGRTEFHEDVPVEDMFPMGEDWQAGPGQDRSGYRKSR